MWGRGEGDGLGGTDGEITKGHEEAFGGIILIVVMVSQLHACIKTYHTGQFKYAQFIVYLLYLIVFKKEFFF